MLRSSDTESNLGTTLFYAFYPVLCRARTVPVPSELHARRTAAISDTSECLQILGAVLLLQWPKVPVSLNKCACLHLRERHKTRKGARAVEIDL